MTASPGLGLEESKNGRKDEQKRESEQCGDLRDSVRHRSGIGKRWKGKEAGARARRREREIV
jgi:hypothetical protein